MSPYFYQLAVGGAVFAAGVYVALRSGEVSRRGRGGRALAGLLAGLVLMALIQGVLELAARP